MRHDDDDTLGDAVPAFDLTPETPQPASAEKQAPAPAPSPVYRSGADAPHVQPVQFSQFGAANSGQGMGNLELLMDVPLPVSVELGRTTMPVKDIMALGPGSVIELERAAGENIDILINGRLIARGEVVVIEENFGVRIVGFVGDPEKAVQP